MVFRKGLYHIINRMRCTLHTRGHISRRVVWTGTSRGLLPTHSYDPLADMTSRMQCGTCSIYVSPGMYHVSGYRPPCPVGMNLWSLTQGRSYRDFKVSSTKIKTGISSKFCVQSTPFLLPSIDIPYMHNISKNGEETPSRSRDIWWSFFHFSLYFTIAGSAVLWWFSQKMNLLHETLLLANPSIQQQFWPERLIALTSLQVAEVHVRRYPLPLLRHWAAPSPLALVPSPTK